MSCQQTEAFYEDLAEYKDEVLYALKAQQESLKQLEYHLGQLEQQLVGKKNWMAKMRDWQYSQEG